MPRRSERIANRRRSPARPLNQLPSGSSSVQIASGVSTASPYTLEAQSPQPRGQASSSKQRQTPQPSRSGTRRSSTASLTQQSMEPASDFYNAEQRRQLPELELQGYPFNVGLHPSRSARWVADLDLLINEDSRRPSSKAVVLSSDHNSPKRNEHVFAYILDDNPRTKNDHAPELYPMMVVDLWTFILSAWYDLKGHYQFQLPEERPLYHSLLWRFNRGWHVKSINKILMYVRSLERPPFWLEPKVRRDEPMHKTDRLIWVFTITRELAKHGSPLKRGSSEYHAKGFQWKWDTVLSSRELKGWDKYVFSFVIDEDGVLCIPSGNSHTVGPRVCLKFYHSNRRCDFRGVDRNYLLKVFKHVLEFDPDAAKYRNTEGDEWLPWLLEKNAHLWKCADGYFWSESQAGGRVPHMRFMINIGKFPDWGPYDGSALAKAPALTRIQLSS